MSLLVDVNAIIHLIDPELLETVRFDWAHGCTAFKCSMIDIHLPVENKLPLLLLNL